MKRRAGRAFLALVLVFAGILVTVDVVQNYADGSSAGLQTSYEEPDSPSRSSQPAGEGPPADEVLEDLDPPLPTPIIVEHGPGTFTMATGGTAVVGDSSRGELYQYHVMVEEDIGYHADAFAYEVDAVLADTRSWIGGGEVAFQRVGGEVNAASFVIYLASPATVDKLCYPLNTAGYTSCRVDNKVVINVARWLLAVPDYGAAIGEYRTYVINHEVGHRLGYQHDACPAAGQLAPIMQQQTLGLSGCLANPWPYVNGALYRG